MIHELLRWPVTPPKFGPRHTSREIAWNVLYVFHIRCFAFDLPVKFHLGNVQPFQFNSFPVAFLAFISARPRSHCIFGLYLSDNVRGVLGAHKLNKLYWSWFSPQASAIMHPIHTMPLPWRRDENENNKTIPIKRNLCKICLHDFRKAVPRSGSHLLNSLTSVPPWIVM